MKYYSWIVIWSVLVTIPISCPDFKPNPYTGEYLNTMCSVNHTDTVKRHMRAEYSTKEEALAFIDKAPKHIKDKMELHKYGL